MLMAGMQGSYQTTKGVRATGVNCQANAAGIFRIVGSLKQVEKLACDSMDNLIKNFPKH